MAIHHSVKRQWRRSLERREINRRNLSALRSQVKKLRTAISDNNREEVERLLPQTFSVIDQTVKKGAIHPNKGDRYKSRLSRKARAISAAASK